MITEIAIGWEDEDGDHVRKAQELVLRVGAARFGPPVAEVKTHVRSITDLERLRTLSVRVFEGSSWEQLLGE